VTPGQVFSWPGDPPADATTVWTIHLDLKSEDLAAAEATLSAEERARARGFPLDGDRRRFAAARAGLRTILGTLLGVTPAELRFRYGALGKPRLDDAFDSTVRFNASQSGDTALVAVSRGRDVGVDIEQIRPVPRLSSLVDRFFSQREREAILERADEPVQAFFYHWTLKEAWLKATGLGLGGPFRSVEVCRGPAGMPLMRQAAGTGEAVPWRFYSWSPASNFVAALAVSQHKA
jgi:4'-phosphopantetheinyl transferase